MATSAKNNSELLMKGYVRNEIEKKYKHIIVPNGILRIFSLFVVYTSIDSLILSDDEKDKLHSMLSAKWNVSFIDFHLLYRGSRDGYESNAFYEKCAVENTLCVVETDESPRNNVFGGFTTKAWENRRDKDRIYIEDKDAFVYLLRSSAGYPSEIFDIKPSQTHKAIVCMHGYIAFFGTTGVPGNILVLIGIYPSQT